MGIPDALFIKANLALEVEVPPKSTSSVMLRGDRAPADLCQKLKLEGLAQVGIPPATVRTSPELPIPRLASVFVPEA